MSKPITPDRQTLRESIRACVENAERLEAESYDLEFREPPTLQLFVLLIAQEEYAKAFLLCLVDSGLVPFSRSLLRAMNDHACKQLVGLVMDYLIMNWETLEELKEMVRADSALGERIPPAVESSVAILRFEKIGRWESRSWVWDEVPSYDPGARRVGEGKADRRKQDALYVRIGGDGRVCHSEPVTREEITIERERLSNFGYLVRGLIEGEEKSSRHGKVMNVIKAMFAEAI